MRPRRRVPGLALAVLLLVVVPCTAAFAATGVGEASPAPAGDADTVPPATTASGAEHLWHSTSVTVTFTATDTGSGVAYTEFKLDAGAWVRDTRVTLPAASDHSGDGLHTVLYRSADNAGNIEQAKSLSVGIDTVRPATRAPSAATVVRYRSVSLAYKVLDAAPNGGDADVTIRIRNAAGVVVRTLAYQDQPVNQLLSTSFTCTLAGGTYRFSVYARDTAGNPQATVGTNRLTVTAPWSTTLPFRFLTTAPSLRDLDPSDYPLLHVDEPVAIVDEGPHDADGVRMTWRDGRLYNHVSGQAFYGLKNLASYTLTGDAFYLARAEAQAQRLIDRRILVGDAWFHPNDFSFHELKPPWCSALGHGVALKLFTALYRVTGKPVYQQAAQGTFRSFLRRGPSRSPWILSVDGSGYLWLQEYPSVPPDPVLNGHIYAAYGLYDYYQATRDERALELFNGAVTTVLRYAPWFRQPNWISFYRYSHRVAWAHYHQTHIGQFLTLYTLTGKTALAGLADDYMRDYPKPGVDGPVRVVPGTYTGRRFGASGKVLGMRTVTITQTTYLSVTRRERIYHQVGYWFQIHSAPWRGYYLRERANMVYLPGVLPLLAYDPPRTLAFPAGHEYVAHTYDASGAVTATLSFTPDAATKATADRRASVNGADKVRVASGPLEGYWLRLGPAELR